MIVLQKPKSPRAAIRGLAKPLTLLDTFRRNARVGRTRPRGFLRRHRRIALDTSVFIYHLEANPRYVGLTDHVFARLEQPEGRAVTSTVTMAELLVQPYRRSDERQVDEFYALLSTYPNLGWVAPSLAVADTTAGNRAAHRLRTPDALQAATAVQSEATCLVTNDAVFERLKEFKTVVGENYL